MDSTLLARRLYLDFVVAFLWVFLPQSIVAAVLFPDVPTMHLAVGAVGALVVFHVVVPFALLLRTARRIEARTSIRTLLDTPFWSSLDMTGTSSVGILAFALYLSFTSGATAAEVAVFSLLGASSSTLAGLLYGVRADNRLRPLIVASFAQALESIASLRRSWKPIPFTMQISTLVGSGLGAALFVMLAFVLVWQDAAGQGRVFGAREALASISVFVVLLGASLSIAYSVGKRLVESATEVRVSLESLAQGQPAPPTWASYDELGVLALRVAEVVNELGGLVVDLRGSAVRLADASDRLGTSTVTQNATLSRQAAALQETEVTAQEIRQTSLLASQKTEAVLRTAEQAEEITRAGELAVEQSLSGLTEISNEVAEMATSIRALGERTRQIVGITATVKELADQSNMLALNAAIEAVRSGEHGKGFAVVAREIRSLADQSLQATRQVRQILEDISQAIQGTVSISERGSDKVRASLVQVQTSGVSLRELSGIVRDNAQAVRQIAAAVGQQNAGIGQIFEAVRDLSRMMDGTLETLQSTEEAAGLVSEVALNVTTAVDRYSGKQEEAADADDDSQAAA